LSSFNPETNNKFLNFVTVDKFDYRNGGNYKGNYKNNLDNNMANMNEIEPKIAHTFKYRFKNNKPNSVLICGSFDKWQVKHPLAYDSVEDAYHITLNLKRGKYYFKFIIDGTWQINPNEKSERGEDGITNNVISL
jgi:hypothetical protein